MSKTASWTVLIVLCSWLLAACAGSPNPDTDVLESGGVSLLKETEPYSGAVGGMGAGGTLDVVQGCLGVTYDDGQVVIVFPPSAELSGVGDDLVVSVDGVDLRVGDRFDSGTRGSGPGVIAEYGDLEEQAPESCRGLPVEQMEDFGRVGRR